MSSHSTSPTTSSKKESQAKDDHDDKINGLALAFLAGFDAAQNEKQTLKNPQNSSTSAYTTTAMDPDLDLDLDSEIDIEVLFAQYVNEILRGPGMDEVMIGRVRVRVEEMLSPGGFGERLGVLRQQLGVKKGEGLDE